MPLPFRSPSVQKKSRSNASLGDRRSKPNSKEFRRLESYVASDSQPSTEDLTMSFASTDIATEFSSHFHNADDRDDHILGVLRGETGRLSNSSLLGATGNSIRGSLNFCTPRSSTLKGRTSLRNTEDLTIDKIQLSRISIYGRSEETETIHACWKRVRSAQGKRGSYSGKNRRNSMHKAKISNREFVVVSGYSGTGKTALVQQLEKPVEDAGGFYASGKCDLQKRGEPYYCVAAACHELCLAITDAQNMRRDRRLNSLSSSPLTREEISKQINEELGPDIKLLTGLLPILNEILGFASSSDLAKASSSSKSEGLGMLEERNRFNYAFRRFLRVMCSFGPVVLVLDDLQWIDVASMDLLEYLIQDSENQSLMVVGMYRSNEVDEAHLLTKMIRDIEYTSKEEGGVNVTKLEIGNLSVSNVNELLDDLLYTDPGRSQKLAEIIHRKTSGNVFFVIQFLLALNAHDLLTFDLGMTCWRWNEDNIEDWTAATANVVDLMREKLQKLDPKVTRKLPMVALMGATFKNRLLSSVLESYDLIANGESMESFGSTEIRRTNRASSIKMMSFLEVCTAEGIIEAAGTDSHRWIHDKIQEASLSLISDSQQKQWRLMLGRILTEKLSEDEIEKNLFLIVNLFLDAIDLVPKGDKFRVEAAMYFCRAGKKAQASSAFRQAGVYHNKGIELLPDNHWIAHYELSLDLFSSAAEAEYCVSDIDKMEAHCTEVLAQQNLPLQDKFRCYLTLVEGPARRNDLNSAIEMTLSILETLDCKFPPKALHAPAAMKRLLSWKGKLHKHITPEQICTLKSMMDAKRIFCMHLLEKMDPFCYISGNLNLSIMVVLKRIAWTIKYGYCLHSASAFSSIGIVYTGALGDIRLGEQCAKLCLSLQKMVGARSIEAGNFLRCYGLNLHQTTPLLTCMKGLLNGYQVGLEMGDLTSAMFSIYQYLELCRASGKSLEVLNADYFTYVKQMKETHQLQALEWALVEHQGVLNLIGQSENTVILTGDVMDQEEVLATVEKTKNLTLRYLVRRKQMYLAGFLDEHLFGADLALEHGNAALQSLAGSNGAISQCLLASLSCLSAYKETKLRKYKVYAKAMRDRIRDWIKKGNPNIGHYGLLLDAEWMTLKRGKMCQAHKMYEEANRFAARCGFIHDRALINERYGEFLLGLGDDTEEGKYRLEEAVKLYSEWGAARKVEILSGSYDIAPGVMPLRQMHSERALLRIGFTNR